jgi:hypothetical protein
MGLMQKIRTVTSAIGLVLLGAGVVSLPRFFSDDRREIDVLDNIIYSESGQHGCFNEIRTPSGMPLVNIFIKSDENGDLKYSFLFNFISSPEMEAENSLKNQINYLLGVNVAQNPPMNLNLGGAVLPISEIRASYSDSIEAMDYTIIEWSLEVYVDSKLIDNKSISESEYITLRHNSIDSPVFSEIISIDEDKRGGWKRCLDDNFREAQEYARIVRERN